MSDYIPTTEEVREAYGEQTNFRRHASQTFTQVFEEEDGEFDRWLAEVKAEAWEEGFQDGHDSAMGVRNTDNPYRQGEEQ